MKRIKTILKLIFNPHGYYDTPASCIIRGLLIMKLDDGTLFTHFLTKKTSTPTQVLTLKRRFKAIKLAYQGKLVAV